MINSKFKNDSSKSPGFLFIRAYNNWYTQIQKALRPINLTHPQFIILTVTAYLQNRGENPTQKMIADHSAIDVMTTSQILKLLEKKQYIQRKQHPTDTRAKIILLLDAGQKKVNQALPLIENIDDIYFGVLQSDATCFMDSLQKLCSFRFGDNES
jgi:DNA-binding MarR family transcriptional regulator